MKLSDFKMQMTNRYCRNCINEMLKIYLEKEDCVYAMYPNPCQRCGKMRNIVGDLHWMAKSKVLFAKSVPMEE